VRFVEESQLIITRITYNSPFDASFKIDLSASNLAEAIGTTIDGVKQAKQRLEKAELENKAFEDPPPEHVNTLLPLGNTKSNVYTRQ
jgi:hypothetical protein